MYKVGDIVLSTKGRDCGNYFIVYAVIDENYVHLVDGDIRKLSKPKLKKIKHIKFTGVNLEKIAKKINEGMRIFDQEVKSALNTYASENK